MNAVRWFLRGSGWGRRSVVRQTAMALLILCTASLASAAIEDPTGTHITPPRLGLVEGDVLFWRPGAGDWEAAQVNVPLAAGDALATRDGKLELQIGGKSFVRAADATQLRLKSHEPDFLQLEVTAGRVAVDLRDLPRGDAIELDTPTGAVRIARDGFYRIDVRSDVGEESTRLIVRRGGQAEVTPAGGSLADVATGEAIEITGTSGARLTALAAPPFDDWDRWNYDRADGFLATPRSYAVASDVYGADELERNGDWRSVETYGRVWVPSSVPAGWAPYTYGRWIWDPLYGYSWVDYAPWGWAPFHYGRWVYAGYWAWAPGPVLAVPVYSPALVAFFGGPGISVGIGVPFVSWVALGWGEPLIPWWGPVGFVGSPCWWGWGGPRVVNNIVINPGDVVHANSVNLHRNMNVPGALIGIPRDRFATRSLDRLRLAPLNESRLTPVHGPLPVPAKGVTGGIAAAPEKMPVPNFARQPGAAAPATNFARTGQEQPGTQRFGAPLPPAEAKTGAATAALDALRNRGPGALTVPSRPNLSRPAVPAPRSTDLSRGQAPPPLPGGSTGGTRGAALDALHGRASSLPAARVGNPTSSMDSFGRLRTAPPPMPRRVAAAERGGSWGRGAIPPPHPAGAAPRMGGQGVSRGGGAPSGGMSRSAPSAASNLGRALGMHGGGGMRGR